MSHKMSAYQSGCLKFHEPKPSWEVVWESSDSPSGPVSVGPRPSTTHGQPLAHIVSLSSQTVWPTASHNTRSGLREVLFGAFSARKLSWRTLPIVLGLGPLLLHSLVCPYYRKSFYSFFRPIFSAPCFLIVLKNMEKKVCE